MAEWDSAYITALPDSAFACVDDSGRHYPHHNADGNLDLPHLRNALSRIDQAGTTTCGRDHLEAHARAAAVGDRADDQAPDLDAGVIPIEPGAVQVRDASRREIDIRLMPWGQVIDTVSGLEKFERGAFADAKPDDVLLHGLEHEAFIGMGQNGQPVITRHPVGKAIALDDRADAQYGTFRVAKTARGDEVLELAAEGLVRGASVEWAGVPGGTRVERHNGRRLSVHSRARLTGASTTYRPAFEQAGVVAVRSQQEEAGSMTDATTDAVAEAAEAEETPVSETPVAAPAPAQDAEQFRSFQEAVGQLTSAVQGATSNLTDRIASLEERARSQFIVPGEQPAGLPNPDVNKGNWLQYALRAMSGDRISTADEQYRALADVVTSDNLGVVPDSFTTELIGVIDPSRPFLSSTRKLPTPSSGMTMHVPKITQRPLVGIQSDEKGDVQSRETHITDETFNAVTKAGGGDLSLQILKRSDPSFLDLYLRLLAEAYAMDSEAEAIEALLGEADINDGLTIDPATTGLGDAFVTSFDAIRRGPDTIWLSSAAVGAFIDAVSPVTGMPMYSSISADFTVPGGINGTIKGLRPVHVPELGAQGADVIIGPSSGFAWAEDGTYTLQVDVPAKAGRDVALVGILWFAPYYPSAFSVYTLAS